MKKPKQRSLNIAIVASEFEKAEESPAHRKGTFKSNARFEMAIDIIAEAKPATK